jgi:hypothetical protein
MSTAYKKNLKTALRVICIVIASAIPPMANAQAGSTPLAAAPLLPCYDSHHKLMAGNCDSVNDGYGMESDTSSSEESGSAVASATGSNTGTAAEGHGDDSSNGTSGSGTGPGNHGKGTGSGA